jgi:hypothetical protein
MNHYFRIFGKYATDAGESLIAERVNGDRIFTREQARYIIGQWQEKIRDRQMSPVADWRIEKYKLEG